MKSKKMIGLVALVAVAIMASGAQAVTLFTLADTNDDLFTHDSDGTNDPAPIPSAGSASVGNGTFAWGDLSTDTSPNTAEFLNGAFTSADWGGDGTFTSNAIDVSSYNAIDINGQFDGLFNVSTEFSNFFYSLDGGTAVDFGVGLEDVTYTDEAVGVAGLDVSGASAMTVGFVYNHNGSSDYFNVDSLSVTGTQIPEPGSIALLLAGVLGVIGLRRRNK